MDLFIGIDVSKATLDVAGCTADGPLAELCSTIANTEAGLATLVPLLGGRAPALGVLEAPGAMSGSPRRRLPWPGWRWGSSIPGQCARSRKPWGSRRRPGSRTP